MARMPNAPGLFSTTICWPSSWRICSPTMRITMSVALAAPNGTSTLIGLDGNLSCAEAAVAPNTKLAAHSKNTLEIFITTPSLVIQVDLDLFCDLLARGNFIVQPAL